MPSIFYKYLLLTVLCLCILDCLLTLYWIEFGFASEFNPIMRYIYNIHPFVFIMIKNTLFLTGITWLWLGIERKLARIGIWIVFVIYLGILIYNIFHILRLAEIMG